MISSRALKCPDCGCPVVVEKPKMVCPECGYEVPESSESCENCGCPVEMFENIGYEIKTKPTDSIESEHKNISVLNGLILLFPLIFILTCLAIYFLPAIFPSSNNEATGSVETGTDTVSISTLESNSYEDDDIEIDTATDPYTLVWLPLEGDNKDLILSDFKEGLSCVQIKEEGRYKYGFIDKNLNIVIPLIYNFARSFSDGRAYVKRDGKSGYIDKSGQEIILVGVRFGDFHEGLAWIKYVEDINFPSSDRYYLMNKSGERVTKCYYTSACDFSDGLAYVYRDGMHMFINKDGEEVIALRKKTYDSIGDAYESVENFSDGLARVQTNGMVGFIDKTGKEVIPLKYSYGDVIEFHEGMARVKVSKEKKVGATSIYHYDKIGFINKNGIEVVPSIYEDAGDFHEGLARVKSGRLWGFIDKKGNEVIPFIYDEVHDFSEGFAAVMKDGMWGFVDKNGQELVSPQYYKVRDFKEGFAFVSNGTFKCGYIDKKGNEVMELEYYEQSSDFSNGVARVIERESVFTDEFQKQYIVKVKSLK